MIRFRFRGTLTFKDEPSQTIGITDENGVLVKVQALRGMIERFTIGQKIAVMAYFTGKGTNDIVAQSVRSSDGAKKPRDPKPKKKRTA